MFAFSSYWIISTLFKSLTARSPDTTSYGSFASSFMVSLSSIGLLDSEIVDFLDFLENILKTELKNDFFGASSFG